VSDLLPTASNPLSPKVKWPLVVGGTITLVAVLLPTFGIDVPAGAVTAVQTIASGILGVAVADPLRNPQ
jgi:uncharacterized membrane protein